MNIWNEDSGALWDLAACQFFERKQCLYIQDEEFQEEFSDFYTEHDASTLLRSVGKYLPFNTS